MKNLKPLLSIAFIATTLLFTSCKKDEEVKKQVTLQDLVVTIDENPTNGQVVGTVQTDESEASGFSITSQTPAGALSIDSGTGELTVADASLFDYETNPVITATISVIDGVNTATVTINLNSVAEINVTDLTIDIDENPTNGQVVGTVQTDESEASGFSITSQTPAGALSIDPSTGELTVADATLFNFETNPVITATISVVDGVNAATVTINLNNLVEVQDLTVAIDENPTNGQVVGTVPNDGSGTFSIASQTPAGALSVNSSTGELTVADASLFDFETNPVITANVEVVGTLNTATATATVDLNNINEVGDFNHGGIVFWVDPTDDTKGLVCATVDQSVGVHWYNGTYTTTGATETAIGTGQVNTIAIVNNQGAGTYAAQLCNDLSLNGYSDWHLPSKDELTAVYMNATVINTTAVSNGLGSLSMSNGGAIKNHNGYYVRAVRAF